MRTRLAIPALAVAVLTGCSAFGRGPRRIDAIDEPLELPVEVTFVEPIDFYPVERQGMMLVENRGRLYLAGGITVEPGSSTERETTYHYDIWTSNDGMRWSRLVDTFYPDVGENGTNYRFYSFDGYLWAAETANRRLNPDAPEALRLFRSVDGTEWQIVNEDYSSAGYVGPIYATDRGATEISGLQPDSPFPSKRVRVASDGIDWPPTELQFADPQDFFDRFFPVIAPNGDVLFAWDIFDNQIGRFDVDSLTWEALPIDPATHARLFLTEVNDRDDRFAAAFVGHANYLYIIAGRGVSAENTWNRLQTRPNWLNDVWRSPDGIEWELVSRHLPFTTEEELERGYRYNFDTFPARTNPLVVSWRGVLYLTGGGGYARWDGEWLSHSGQDAWVSRDGQTWYELVRVRGSRRSAEPLIVEPSACEFLETGC